MIVKQSIDLELITDITNALGVDIRCYNSKNRIDSDFDYGLRARLYNEFDYNSIFKKITENCEHGVVYNLHDLFQVSYIAFIDKSNLYITEPFLSYSSHPDPYDILIQNKLAIQHLSTLEHFYFTIPTVINLEKVIQKLLSKSSSTNYKIRNWNSKRTMVDHEVQFSEKNDVLISMIEEKYNLETILLNAIKNGNHTQAIIANSDLSQQFSEYMNLLELDEARYYVISLNAEFRRAVYDGNVHPFYIDKLSAVFSRKIKDISSLNDLYVIVLDMIKKYCQLVDEYSQDKYSKLIGNVINYIVFNLHISHTVQDIAEKFNVHPSYLSNQFKSEVGVTLINYINEVRIRQAEKLLYSTKMSIGNIAQSVGIYDENYFSRLFKKYSSMTPTQYRKNIEKSYSKI